MKVGNAINADAVIAPLVDMKAVEKVEAHIADAVKNGAKVAVGGKRGALGRHLLLDEGADRCDDRYGHHQG